MKNTIKYIISGISNDIAELRRPGDSTISAYAYGAKYIGAVGDEIELLDKDAICEGQLAEYQQAMSDYNAEVK